MWTRVKVHLQSGSGWHLNFLKFFLLFHLSSFSLTSSYSKTTNFSRIVPSFSPEFFSFSRPSPIPHRAHSSLPSIITSQDSLTLPTLFLSGFTKRPSLSLSSYIHSLPTLDSPHSSPLLSLLSSPPLFTPSHSFFASLKLTPLSFSLLLTPLHSYSSLLFTPLQFTPLHLLPPLLHPSFSLSSLLPHSS